VLKKYKVIKDTIVIDMGTHESDRFKIVDKVPKTKEFQVLHFKKDGEYLGALRTEVGKFLLSKNLLVEI
jgi:uncharacterized hydantoinase/oxoprolinase family protein